MLYLLRHLRTTLSFLPTDIDKVGDSKQVWAKLREKIEGKCTNQYGMIVHIPNPDIDADEEKSILPLARLDSKGGCTFQIQFSAISFKAEKNDLMWAKVIQLSPQCITCSIGPVEVKIPRSKLDFNLEYDKSLNCFRFVNKTFRIQIGDFLICSCFESRLSMGNQIQVIAELTKPLLEICMNLKA